ncbi:MAG: DEAD/DEAH box helicase family protein [Atopobiaceae bacterium]|nr:DEAD/DEAH box helicase family protein [Atopobiaceae bacterium]
MRIRLKQFQREAADRLLSNIVDMYRLYDREKKLSWTCLQAPTGSGKTVISADVIETLFFGSDERGIDGDPYACVLWVSESPDLNAQTCDRFMEMSEMLADNVLDHRHVETIEKNFCATHDELECHHVYFLSRDLLGKDRLLVKGSEANGGRTFWDVLNKTIEDPRRHLYLFIDEAHRGLNVRAGSGQGAKTIYANLIDGVDERAPMPVVIGISATPKRFEDAMMARADERWMVSTVSVTPAVVQESGLLKEAIDLYTPMEDERIYHQYIDQACDRYEESRALWNKYCEREGIEPVIPLLVIQVNDRPANEMSREDERLKELCEQISAKIPDLDPKESFAHVFSEHEDRRPGGRYLIHYVRPEEVSRRRQIQVLFAKEAISTGWDCPRAEVIVSLRRRSDPTYIEQLIGRLVRTPLARRVDGEDMLNSVACYLLRFDPSTTAHVVAYLRGDLNDDPSGDSFVGPKLITNPIDTKPASPRSKEDYETEKVEYEKEKKKYDAARKAYDEWKSRYDGQVSETDYSTPTGDRRLEPKGNGQIGVSADGGYNPEIDAQQELTQDSELMVQSNPQRPSLKPPKEPMPLVARDSSFTKEEWKAIRAAWDTIVAERIPGGSNRNPFTALQDTATLMMDAGWDSSAGADVRKEFRKQLDAQADSIHDVEYEEARRNVEKNDMQMTRVDRVHGTVEEQGLSYVADDITVEFRSIDAKRLFGGDVVTAYRKECRVHRGMSRRDTDARLAACVSCEPIMTEMRQWAKRKRDGYLEAHRFDLDYASDEHKQRYLELQNESGITISRKVAWPSEKVVAGSNKEGMLDRYPRHIAQDDDGLYPLDLNDLERHVICREMTRPNAIAFYRNPDRGGSSSAFTLSYSDAKSRRAACHPDFLFFMRDATGTVHPAIVDGHGAWIGDALAKLRGYVRYLREHPDVFAQVLSVSDLRESDEYRYINLKDKVTQDTILEFSGDIVEDLYRGELSHPYGNRSENNELAEKLGVVKPDNIGSVLKPVGDRYAANVSLPGE